MTLQVVFRSPLKSTEDILSIMGHLEIAMLAHTCTSNSTNWAQLAIAHNEEELALKILKVAVVLQ